MPPESVRLVRLSRSRQHPWVIGTNLHVRQGQAEITPALGAILLIASKSAIEHIRSRKARFSCMRPPDGLWRIHGPRHRERWQ